MLKNKLSSKVDQRDVLMPPVWVPISSIGQKNKQDHSESIFTSGNDKYLTNRIVEMLGSAKSTAILCSFLLADETVEDAIDKATERGIRVYLMLACENQLDNDNPDDDFEAMCLSRHKAMLKRLAGKVMIRSAPHYHAKAILIDAIGPNKSEAQGLLLTANLTREALERNEELAVSLSPPEIEKMVDIFRWSFFENAEHQMLDNVTFASVKPINEVNHPSNSDPILSTTGESQSIRTQAFELIDSATSHLIISSFSWQEDHQITQSICDKAKAGVDVVILTRISPSSMRTLMKLKSAGAKVFGFKWLHAKAIWNDTNNAMVMSANLQRRGLDSGFEMGIKLSDNRSSILKECLLSFLSNRHSELLLNTTLGNLDGSVKVWDNNQFKDVDIQKHVTKHLDSLVAKCASNLDEKPNIPDSSWTDSPTHEIEYQWVVKSPLLPKDAREIFWEEKQKAADIDEKTDSKKDRGQHNLKMVKHSYSPKVYKTANNNVFIAISNGDEIGKAITLRDQKFAEAKIVMLSSH